MPKKPTATAMLPHSSESEYTILGCIMMGESQYLKMLTPAHFYDKTYALIYKTLQEIQEAGKEPDFIEACSALADKQEVQKIGGVDFLMDLTNKVVSVSLAPSAVRVIQDKYSKRCAIKAGQKLAEIGADNDHDVTELPQLIAEASRKIAEIIPRAVEMDKDAIIKDLLTVDEKIPTGFADMDAILDGGLEAGWVFLIAARPSVGKSAMASTMMANFLKAGVPPLFISLEMSQKQVLKRMLSAYYETDKDEVLEKGEALVRGIQTPWYMYHNDDISGILQQIYTTPAQVIIIDYFGLISSKSKENSVQKANDISRDLKNAAMEAGKPIILLWQLNRDVEKDKAERQPRLSDLYGGGEKDPDQITFLHNPNAKEELSSEAMTMKEAMKVENPIGEIEWVLRKNRHGATGYTRLKFEKKKSLMTEEDRAFVINKPKKVEPATSDRKDSKKLPW